MPSKNSSSRGNQQERLKIIGWIVGFVDGEGCFTISLHKNPTTSSGWQIMPEFIVTQGEKSKQALKVMRNFFGCGSLLLIEGMITIKKIFIVIVFDPKRIKEIIIPFFKQYPLKTSKRMILRNFLKFCP